MRVLVTGGRDYGESDDDETGYLWGLLDGVHAIKPITALIHGAHRKGADALADQWGNKRLVAVLRFPAHWDHTPRCEPGCSRQTGRAAGPIRNERMIDEAKTDVAIAFPGGDGTLDTVTRARHAKVLVIDADSETKR